MSFFKPAEPKRNRVDGDTSDRPGQRRRTDAPQQQYLIKHKTQTLEGNHSNWVYSVSFSADGTKVASGSFDKTVKLWDVTSGECLQTLEGHSHRVNSVSFSPDGTKIASGYFDDTVKLWDATNGELLRTYVGHSNWVYSVSFSPDGTKVASGSFDKTVKLWDVTSGECLQTLVGHSSGVKSVSFSPDGTKVASGSYDKTVKLWDVTSGELLRTYEGHSSYVQSVSFSPDGSKIASGSDDNTVKLWDVTSGELLRTYEGHSRGVNSVMFSPDGTKVASRSQDRTVRVWDVTSGQCLQTLRHSNLWSVSFSQDGVFLRIASTENKYTPLLEYTNIIITTYAFPWVIDMIDAKNTLLAFAIRQFKNDPLPFVRRMYPQFYDGTHYLFYKEDEGTIERKSQQEIIEWYNARLAEEKARQTPNAVHRNSQIVGLKF